MAAEEVNKTLLVGAITWSQFMLDLGTKPGCSFL
jgi:hypothetical protein